MQPYTKACLDRFDGNAARAIKWLETERAQAMYIAANSRHKPTTDEARAVCDRMTDAIAEIESDLPDTAGRVVTAICGIAIAAGAFCFAMALATPARAETYTIVAVDAAGNEYAAGAGTSCDAAWENAVLPENMTAVECVMDDAAAIPSN